MGYEQMRDAVAGALEQVAQEWDLKGKAKGDEARCLHDEAEHMFSISRFYREGIRQIRDLGPEDALPGRLHVMVEERDGRKSIHREQAEALDREFEKFLKHPGPDMAEEVMRILEGVAARTLTD